MPRRKLFTSDVINRIEPWLDAGLSPTAIAEKIGCTLGTLRVRCSQINIKLRRKMRVPRRGQDAELQSPRRASSQTDEGMNARLSTQTTDPIEQGGYFALRLPQPILGKHRMRAALEGVSEGVLAGMLLEVIVKDDLYEAVLDVDAPK